MSVQIRIYQQVWSVANESKRFRQEAQALLSLDHQIIQGQFAMMHQQPQTRQEEVVTTKLSSGSALLLITDGAPMGVNGPGGALCEGSNDDGGGGYLMPPPAYGSSAQLSPTIAGAASTVDELMVNGFASGSGQNTPTSTIFPAGNPSDGTDSTISAPATPTPTKATFVVEETKTTTTKTDMMVTHPTPPTVIHALRDVHQAQDSVDAAEDAAALRGTLADALDAGNDVEMVRRLQVGREEIPEATETLRRELDAGGTGVDGNRTIALEHGEHSTDMKNTELDRKFMQGGIEAMVRLTSAAAKQPRSGEEKAGLGEGTGAVGASELPSWTITRYICHCYLPLFHG